METRPKIEIVPTSFDIGLERLGAVMIIVLWALALFFIISMPSVVPIHFDATGRPDGFGSKFALLILPALGTLVFFGIGKLNKYPHVFNYATKITEANAHRQYSIAVRMLRMLKVTLVFLFLAILLYTYLNVKGRVEGLGIWFLPITLALVLLPIGISIWKSLKK